MKFLKWLLIILALGAALFVFVGMPYLRKETKKYSPEKSAVYDRRGYDLEVRYSSPSKKGRDIFGALVPYGEIWRTGANEPTTFRTGTNIQINDKPLPAGTYSLWTKPGKDRWTVIFNKDIPDWGVSMWSGGKETTRISKEDALAVEVPVQRPPEPEEHFTISFEDTGQPYMILVWDDTRIQVPIHR